MADISVTSINKFIRETYDESEIPKSVPHKQQLKFLEELMEQFKSDDRLSCHINSVWDYEEQKSITVPELQISYSQANSDRWRNDRANFSIGFRDNQTELLIWSSSWRSREPKEIRPLSSPENISGLLEKIEERFKLHNLKNKKKSSTEGFKMQALKALINQMAEELQFDFAIENKHHHFRIHVRKDDAGPLCIKIPKGKNAKSESEKLPAYIEHSLVHMSYSKVISNSKLTSYQTNQLDWNNHS